MLEAEQFLLDFHRLNPGCTSVAFAEGRSLETGLSSYELLSSLANDDQVLDLGCGDGHLLELLDQRPGTTTTVGLDFSPDELIAARARHATAALVRGKAQRLPFPEHSFSLVLSHFAFHLMSDLDILVDEIARILKPGGRFAAIIGGGPKVGDSFELFLDLLHKSMDPEQQVPRIGERQARTQEGLEELFGGHSAFENQLEFEDFYVDFGGSFDEVWTRLATVYDLMYYTPAQANELRRAFHQQLDPGKDQRIPCTMAIRRVTAVRVWS